MKPIAQVLLKNKVITDAKLIKLIQDCLIETGGIGHVQRNLTELGYDNFDEIADSKLDESYKTGVINLNEFSSNQFLVICLVIFATVKEIEDDVLIATPFDEGIELLRGI